MFKAIPFPPVPRLKLEPSMTMHQEDPWPEELFCIYMEGKSIKLNQMKFSFRIDAGNHHMIHGRMKNRLYQRASVSSAQLDVIFFAILNLHSILQFAILILLIVQRNNSSQAHQTIEHLNNHCNHSKTARVV